MFNCAKIATVNSITASRINPEPVREPGFRMRARINYLTIAVTDLHRSFRFYKEGLGLPTKGIKKGSEDHALFNLGNGLSLVLFEKKDFLSLTGNQNEMPAGTGFIISHFAESKAEVDLILQRALKAGAKRVGKTREERWSYSVCFSDPDGYQWELAWEA